MIADAAWTVKGNWGDENSPPYSTWQIPVYGWRTTPPIPLIVPLEYLGSIGGALVWWRWNEYGTLKMYSALDGEDFQEIETCRLIPGINQDVDLSARSLTIKIFMKTDYVQLYPLKSPEFYELLLVVMDASGKWATLDLTKLRWLP